MKKNAVLLLLSLMFMAFSLIDDAISRIGSTMEEMKTEVLNNVDRSEFSIWASNNVKTVCTKIPAGQQAPAVKAALQAIRIFVESDEFKKAYESNLRSRWAIDEKRNVSPERKQEIQRQLENYNAEMMNMMIPMEISANESIIKTYVESPPEAQKMLLPMIPGQNLEKAKEKLEQLKKVNSMLKTNFAQAKKDYIAFKVEQTIDMEEVQAKSDNAHNQAEFEKHMQYKTLIISQLKDFLNDSENIDFSAQTKMNQYHRKEFVNPAYESKPGEWKFYFRCGKEPVTAAREFCQAWLKDLER
ncbi:hypothetical protein SAMN04515674_102517 [Pseudarcicella hirudinis]|uniref:Uncharacterized protein n=1 Tax=Pseudarcicella hirudinis TaxID=1079859 RepID=A0A1I5PJX9_9BACT|nr:hypothetical protein [Pseudarcicella hirudinis]SFP34428.1 hypothetical protein SAMN04515674_102517 [Pseudarcicella hirudinis]